MVQGEQPPESFQGFWRHNNRGAKPSQLALHDAILQINRPVFITQEKGEPVAYVQGEAIIGGDHSDNENGIPLLGFVPPLKPENLGNPVFTIAHQLKYPYVAGAMANGITTVDMVVAMGKAGMIGFFGSGGLTIDQIERAVDQVQRRIDDHPYGFNLIHSPYSTNLEMGTVSLYLRKQVKRISAAAFLDITLPLVYYRVKGIHQDRGGEYRLSEPGGRQGVPS